MKTYLLLGAGFSRNWGGWLAAEVFEYLLGSDEVFHNELARSLLWRYRDTGGFESAYAEAEHAYRQDENVKNHTTLRVLQSAIQTMFSDMNETLFKVGNWEVGDRVVKSTSYLLSQFDAIFTLNQDQLLEAQYQPPNLPPDDRRSWRGFALPGTTLIPETRMQGVAGARVVLEDASNYVMPDGVQPVYKLHGSSAWSSSINDEIMVLGTNKHATIANHPILTWYFNEFERALAEPNSRLMVIGYGFRDDHVNAVINKAVETAKLKFFVMDPLGAGLASSLNPPEARNLGWSKISLEHMFEKGLYGASRRSLIEILGKDEVELKKIHRFFKP